MKILAIENQIPNVEWEGMEDLLKEEAQYVYDLYLSGSFREIYFTKNKNAILILEAVNKKEAIKLLDKLPLVKYGKIKFEVVELLPYTGYDRIMK